MAEWTEVALRFMGDGTRSVGELLDQATSGLVKEFLTAKRDLRTQIVKLQHGKDFLEIGARLDQILTDFCRPFGQLRYVSGILPDLDLSAYKQEMTQLAELFRDLEGMAREWATRAKQAGAGQPLPPRAAWDKRVAEVAEKLEMARKQVKLKLAIETRVQDSYRQWDECLAKFLTDHEPLWVTLRQIGFDMKKDGFSDLDHWKTRLREWRQVFNGTKEKARLAAVSQASQVLETYCKMKHLQKVLSVW